MPEFTAGELSENEIMNEGSKILWHLRQLNETLKLEGFHLQMDESIEQVQALLDQIGHLGERLTDFTEKCALLEEQVNEAQRQNDALLAEMRQVREVRDNMLMETEDNWKADVEELREQAELAARERTDLIIQLNEARQDVDHLKADKHELEISLGDFRRALAEREAHVSTLRERLDLLEELDDPANCSQSEEMCETADSGVDTTDLRKARLNRSIEERLRSDDLQQELDVLRREFRKLESDKEDLEARLHARSPDSSPESSALRPGFSRSLSLQAELRETSFFQNLSFLSGGDADRTPVMSSLNQCLDESTYADCVGLTEGSLDGGPDSRTGNNGTVSEALKTKRAYFRWTDVLICFLLYIIVDVISFNVFGQHVISLTRIDRHNRHTAIF